MLKAPCLALSLSYSLMKEGDTTQLTSVGGSEVPIDLRDGERRACFPQAAYFDSQIELYLSLTGSAPYRLLFPTAIKSYTVTPDGSTCFQRAVRQLP
jgi:hypothetical protein